MIFKDYYSEIDNLLRQRVPQLIQVFCLGNNQLLFPDKYSQGVELEKEQKMKSLEVLAQLHHDLGLGELVLDHNGRSSIKIDSGIIVTFELDIIRDQIELIGIVLKGPFNDKAALYSRLLHDNFRSNLAGARLALDSSQEQVLLCQTLTTEHISHSHVELAVARFVTLCEEFRDNLCADGDTAVSNQLTESTTPLTNAFADMPFGMIQA